MKNTNALGGMPVVCNGARVGRVLSVQLTPDLRAMAGLHVDCGLRGRRYISAQGVRMLGDVAVLVDAYPGRTHPVSAGLPRRALSPEGVHLGCITGAWVDEFSHGVEALELSGGILEDILSGRVRVRSYHVQRDSGDIVICPEGGEKP